MKNLVRRLYKTKSLNYDERGFFVVIKVSELHKRLNLIVQYEPHIDVFNHVKIYCKDWTYTKLLGGKIVDFVNKDPKKHLYFIKDFRCRQNCVYSNKNI